MGVRDVRTSERRLALVKFEMDRFDRGDFGASVRSGLDSAAGCHRAPRRACAIMRDHASHGRHESDLRRTSHVRLERDGSRAASR
jgi:hypothetical protein